MRLSRSDIEEILQDAEDTMDAKVGIFYLLRILTLIEIERAKDENIISP